MIYHYKLGLSQVEARLAEHRNQEVKYCKKIRILEFKVESRANCIESITKELELIKKEKEGLDSKLEGFQTASKDLDNLLESQRSDKSKEGLGYSAVPPPPAQVYYPPKKDLSWIGLPKFADDTVTDYIRPPPAIESIIDDLQNKDPSVTKTRASPKNFPLVTQNFPLLIWERRETLLRPQHVGFRNLDRTQLTKVQIASVSVMFKKYTYIDTQGRLNGCSRHMTGNISYLSDYEPFNEGYVSFGQGGCKILAKELSKPNSVLFTDSECIVLGRNFKLLDDANVLLRIPRQHNMYSIDLNNIVPHKDLTCLVAKAFADECMLWHMRLERDQREFSNARTPQQNGVAERRNMTLIEAARTMLADAKLLVTFWAEAVNTAYNLGKFEAKGDGGYFIGYFMSSKTFRVFNKRTKRVEENLHVDFLENKAIEKGAGLNWLFNIDSLTKSMNYVPVVVAVHLESSSSQPHDACNTDEPKSSGNSNPTATSTNPLADQMEALIVETSIPTVSSPVSTVCFIDSQEPSSDTRLISKRVTNQEKTPSLDNILTLENRFEDMLRVTTNSDESNGVEADVSNMETTITTSPTPTLRIHKDYTKSKIIGPVDTPIQTRHKSKEVGEQSFIATIHQKTDPALLQFCLFSCFLSQVEPKKISDALQDPSRVEEEGIDYDEVLAPVARIEAIRLFLAYASFMGFTVYPMDVKSAFLYDTINEEVGTIDQTLFIRRKRGDFILVQVYVDDIIFGSSNPQLCREFEALMHEKFQMSAMDELNFFLDVRSANIPMDKENPWGKDGTGKDVDLHLYRSMIGSLMYLTTSRPDIMFAVCACAMHQVTPKECHLHAVKRIFRYLKGHPKLGLWYPKESPFDLVAYSDSDYDGATQDRKSTTGGC
nr:hypothetical protein [Tanacetum cinerariifolium]